MQCNHKPAQAGHKIITPNGRFYACDQVQVCRKCGKRIVMPYKKLFGVITILLTLLELGFLLGAVMFIWDNETRPAVINCCLFWAAFILKHYEFTAFLPWREKS